MIFVWEKLSAARWIDAWEERFAGNANLVIEYLKGGKSIRLRLFCETQKEADSIFGQFGGSDDAQFNKIHWLNEEGGIFTKVAQVTPHSSFFMKRSVSF